MSYTPEELRRIGAMHYEDGKQIMYRHYHDHANALEKLAMAREALEFCRKMAIGPAEKEYLDKTIYAIREKP